MPCPWSCKEHRPCRLCHEVKQLAWHTGLCWACYANPKRQAAYELEQYWRRDSEVA